MQLFDIHTLLIITGVAGIGGLIGLDRTAVGQFMLSQPIVAAPLMGWLLGDPMAGIIIGTVLELIWVLDMPIGSFVPANSTVSSISATAIASLSSSHPVPLPMIGFCLFLTTGMVPLTMWADTIIRKWTARLGAVADSASGEKAGSILGKAHLSGLAAFYFKSFMLYLIFIPAGIALAALFVQLPEYVHRASSFFVKLLPFLGVAIIIRKLSIKLFDMFLLAGFSIAVVLGQFFHASALVLILMTIAGGLLGAKYSELDAQ